MSLDLPDEIDIICTGAVESTSSSPFTKRQKMADVCQTLGDTLLHLPHQNAFFSCSDGSSPYKTDPRRNHRKKTSPLLEEAQDIMEESTCQSYILHSFDDIEPIKIIFKSQFLLSSSSSPTSPPPPAEASSSVAAVVIAAVAAAVPFDDDDEDDKKSPFSSSPAAASPAASSSVVPIAPTITSSSTSQRNITFWIKPTLKMLKCKEAYAKQLQIENGHSDLKFFTGYPHIEIDDMDTPYTLGISSGQEVFVTFCHSQDIGE